jgi:hypothetical protein
MRRRAGLGRVLLRVSGFARVRAKQRPPAMRSKVAYYESAAATGFHPGYTHEEI